MSDNVSSVYMQDFEIEATSIEERPTNLKSNLNLRSLVILLASVLLILLAVGLFLSAPFLKQNSFIAQLEKKGARVQTVAVHPSWLVQFTTPQRPNDGWFQTLWTANLIPFDVTDEELKKISELSPRLTHLSICSPHVTEAGLSEIVKAKSLKHLSIYACPQITREKINELTAIYPKLNITWRGSAYLGLKTDMAMQHGKNFIAWIDYKSPADESGISHHDIIHRIEGHEIVDDYTIPDVLNDYKPGDSIKIEVTRRGKPKSFDITLADWRAFRNQF